MGRIPDAYYVNQQQGIGLADHGPFLTEEDLLSCKEGLTKREMLCLRLGVVYGHTNSLLVSKRIEELASLCTPKEIERIFAELFLLRGEIGCTSVIPTLEKLFPEIKWQEKDPKDLIEITKTEKGLTLSADNLGKEGVSERELCLLGIGITFGTRCWYT